jgi:hypothetical protein
MRSGYPTSTFLQDGIPTGVTYQFLPMMFALGPLPVNDPDIQLRAPVQGKGNCKGGGDNLELERP